MDVGWGDRLQQSRGRGMDNILGLRRVTTGLRGFYGFCQMWSEKPMNLLVCLGSSVSRQINKDFIRVSVLLSTKQDYNFER